MKNRRPVWFRAVMGSLAWLALGLAVVAGASALEPAARGVWFDAMAREALREETLIALTRHCTARWFGGDSEPAAEAELERDVAPRIVLLSVSDGERPAFIGIGAAHGLLGACVAALDTVALPPGFETRWVRVDVVFDAVALPQHSLAEPLSLELGRHGLALGHPSGVALVPEELVARSLVSTSGMLDVPRLEDYVRLSRPGAALAVGEPLDLYRFRTVYGFARSGHEVAVGGTGREPQLGLGRLSDAARAAGDYLTRSVQASGRFNYVFPRPRSQDDDATSGEGAVPSGPYNILRHAGTVYSMLELFEVDGDPELLAAAESSLDFLVAQVAPCKLALQEHRCVVERDEVKLGGNALATAALAKHADLTGDRRHLPTMLALSRWIRAVQTTRGRFAIHLQNWPRGEVRAFASGYYSGQAILALVHLYEVTRDESLLDDAVAASRYLIEESPAATLSGATVNHWELIALAHLHPWRPDPAWPRRSRELADLVLATQHMTGAPLEAIGGFDEPPRPHPTRLEALAAAHTVLSDADDDVGPLMDGLTRGVAYQLHRQYTPAQALYLDAPAGALGGFRTDLDRREVRIDHVQHNLSAILALDRLHCSLPTTSTVDRPIQCRR